MPSQAARQYVVFDEARLRDFLRNQQERQADLHDEQRPQLTPTDIQRVLATLLEGIELEQVSVPLVTFVAGDDACHLQPTQGVFAVTPSSPDDARSFSQAILNEINSEVADKAAMLLRIGVDPALSLSEYSVPVVPGADIVGTWQNAFELINAEPLANLGLD